jgi:cytochrome c peroxidase
MQKYINDDPYFKNYTIEKADQYLNRSYKLSFKNKDFETFDRIEFYKKYIQPLYEELGNGTEDLMILKEFSGWNVRNKNFFSSDFLDPYFYTLKSSEDNTELRNLGKSIFMIRI